MVATCAKIASIYGTALNTIDSSLIGKLPSISSGAIILIMNPPAETYAQGTYCASSADYNYFYYEEYKKLYAASFMLSTQVAWLSNSDEGTTEDQGGPDFFRR